MIQVLSIITTAAARKHYEKDKEVIERLVAILRGNPYSDQLRTMGKIGQIDDYCMTLNLDQKMDQRVYNASINYEVAAVWIEGSERRGQFQHSVILQEKIGKCMAFGHTMDVMTHYHTLCSSLEVNLGGILTFQRQM
jgi:hypothetical protein